MSLFQKEYVPVTGGAEWMDWVRRDEFGYWVWFRGDGGNYLALFRDEAHYTAWDVEERKPEDAPIKDWSDVLTLNEAELLLEKYEREERV